MTETSGPSHPASSSPNPSLIGGVPALVVSGFLGAGKTTLVKHLLADAQRQKLKLAVVSNEFGDLGIDQALLQESGGPGYVELEGGCVCCQLSNELRDTVQRLWETVKPDRIVVETSGVALPFETLMTLTVGTLSVIDPDLVGSTVWRRFGEDYGYFPLVQPLIGLVWLMWPMTMESYGIRDPRSQSSDNPC